MFSDVLSKLGESLKKGKGGIDDKMVFLAKLTPSWTITSKPIPALKT
jgi:hypothetical protein